MQHRKRSCSTLISEGGWAQVEEEDTAKRMHCFDRLGRQFTAEMRARKDRCASSHRERRRFVTLSLPLRASVSVCLRLCLNPKP